MNVEYLKKFKEELEKENKYCLIEELSETNIKNTNKIFSLKEITEQENTDEIVKECTKFFKKYILDLVKNDIPFDQIGILSNSGFFCKPKLVEDFNALYQNENVLDANWDKTMNSLDKFVLPKLIPVSFSLNGAYTGTESSDLGEFGYKIDYNDKISGVVNLEEFILKMKALGFDIEFANYYGGISFQDYINSIKENGLDTFISITANFSKSNENNYRI